MTGTAFKALILRYADGRRICNCGEAYYSPAEPGTYWTSDGHVPDVCRDGCSANLINAKYEMAKRGRWWDLGQ